MHAVLFTVKRIHQGALRVGRRVLVRTPLTSARYELMHAVAVAGPIRGVAARRQSDLWKVLGVTRTTVSKMLERMEQRGLVRRTVDPRDRRQRWVELTREGAAALRLGRKLAGEPIAALVDHMFPECGYQADRPPDVLLTPDTPDYLPPLAAALRTARRRIADRARLRLPLLERPAVPARSSDWRPVTPDRPPRRPSPSRARA